MNGGGFFHTRSFKKLRSKVKVATPGRSPVISIFSVVTATEMLALLLDQINSAQEDLYPLLFT